MKRGLHLETWRTLTLAWHLRTRRHLIIEEALYVSEYRELTRLRRGRKEEEGRLPGQTFGLAGWGRLWSVSLHIRHCLMIYLAEGDWVPFWRHTLTGSSAPCPHAPIFPTQTTSTIFTTAVALVCDGQHDLCPHTCPLHALSVACTTGSSHSPLTWGGAVGPCPSPTPTIPIYHHL